MQEAELVDRVQQLANIINQSKDLINAIADRQQALEAKSNSNAQLGLPALEHIQTPAPSPPRVPATQPVPAKQSVGKAKEQLLSRRKSSQAAAEADECQIAARPAQAASIQVLHMHRHGSAGYSVSLADERRVRRNRVQQHVQRRRVEARLPH